MTRKGTSPEPFGKYFGREDGFQLSLPMMVLGCDLGGRDFEEKTILDDMSHLEASFKLKRPVAKGTPLKLIISLPPRLSEGQDLRLVIRGTVSLIEPYGLDNPLHKICLKLGSRYVIKPEASDESN